MYCPIIYLVPIFFNESINVCQLLIDCNILHTSMNCLHNWSLNLIILILIISLKAPGVDQCTYVQNTLINFATRKHTALLIRPILETNWIIDPFVTVHILTLGLLPLCFSFSRITFCHLPFQSKWLYVGTERGNTHIVNIESFVLSGYVINWNKAIELWVVHAPKCEIWEQIWSADWLFMTAMMF